MSASCTLTVAWLAVSWCCIHFAASKATRRCRNQDKQEVPRLRFPTAQPAARDQFNYETHTDPIDALSQSITLEYVHVATSTSRCNKNSALQHRYQSMQHQRAASVEPEEQFRLSDFNQDDVKAHSALRSTTASASAPSHVEPRNDLGSSAAYAEVNEQAWTATGAEEEEFVDVGYASVTIDRAGMG